MERRVFLCNTVFQVLVAMWINHTYFKGDERSDIIISDHMNGARDITDRMQQYGEFKNAYFVESLDAARNRIPENHFSFMKKEWNPYRYIKRTFDLNVDYDHIFVSNLDPFTKRYFSAVAKNNPNVNVHIFEDGLSTYSKLFETWFRNSGRPDYDLLRGVLYDYVYRKKYIKDYVKDIWLLTPEFLQWDPWVPVKTVEKINPKDSVFLEMCNMIFGYYDSNDVYDRKYIFMEESFLAEGKEIPDVKLLNEIADRVGKENIMVKVHPRNPVNRFKELGYKTNQNTSIPWEVICMNTKDLSDKVLITFRSVSVLTPVLLFGQQVHAYSLINLANDDENAMKNLYDPVWEILSLLFKKYNQMFTMVNSINEIG